MSRHAARLNIAAVVSNVAAVVLGLALTAVVLAVVAAVSPDVASALWLLAGIAAVALAGAAIATLLGRGGQR